MTVDRAPAPAVSTAPPPRPRVASWLEVEGRRCDLATRALVLGVPSPRPRLGDEGDGWLQRDGADLVEQADGGGRVATDPDALAGGERLTGHHRAAGCRGCWP